MRRRHVTIALLTLSAVVVMGAESCSSTESGSDKATKGKVGTALKNAGTTYTVTKVSTAKKIGDPTLLGAKADGTFVIVDLSLTNGKDETKTFDESAAKLVASDDTKYETDTEASIGLGEKSLLLKDMQPDLPTNGQLVFDVPPAKTKGAKLVIEDFWGNGSVEINLGL